MPAQELHSYMLNVENLKRQHPLLIAVREVAAEDLGNGSWTKLYEFQDQGSCCFVPWNTTYRGQVWHFEKYSPSCSTIKWRATAAAGVVIEHEICVSAGIKGEGHSNEQSVLKQSTWVKAPLLLRGLTLRMARRAHTEMFSRLESELASITLRAHTRGCDNSSSSLAASSQSAFDSAGPTRGISNLNRRAIN